jgi:putative transposase
VLSDGGGAPLAVVVAGANVHDTMLLQDTLEAVFVEPPCPLRALTQHLCLDKGFDNPTGRAATEVFGYVPHIRRIGEEPRSQRKRRRHERARRWVVERLGAWLNGCRAILVRWAKKSRNYLALIKLQCILLWYRKLYHQTF